MFRKKEVTTRSPLDDCSSTLSQNMSVQEVDSPLLIRKSSQCNPRSAKKAAMSQLAFCTPQKGSKLRRCDSVALPFVQNDIPADNYIKSHVMELESIQESTRQLAERERELRRQLKKLKKLYLEKEQELMRGKEESEERMANYRTEINAVNQQKGKISEQLTILKTQIEQLSTEAARARKQVNSLLVEKQTLLSKMSAISSRYQTLRKSMVAGTRESSSRVGEIISQNAQLWGVERQIGTIDKMIGRAKKKGQNEEIIRLYEMRMEYMEQKEWLRIKAERQGFRKAVQGHQSTTNRRKQSKVYQKENQNPPTNLNYFDKTEQETSESWLNSTSQQFSTSVSDRLHQTIPEQSLQQTDEQRQDLQAYIVELVRQRTIKGYEESYQAIEDIIEALFSLNNSQEVDESKGDFHPLKTSIDRLSSSFTTKAQQQAQKIAKMIAACNSLP